jgi:hypothetical protein
MGVDWIQAALSDGLAPLVDVVSWHPYQLTEMPEALDRPRHPWAPPEITSYEDAFRYLRRVARARGFRGTFQANEAGAYAIHRMRSTALVSAKYMARSMILYSSLQVPVFWNEAVSLMRPAWQPFFSPGQPDVQPDYSYYVLRVLSTLMNGMEPSQANIGTEIATPEESGRIEHHLFVDSRGRLLLALWRPLPGSETMGAVSLSVELKGAFASSANGIELFNGEEQELSIQTTPGGTKLDGLLVRDYPLLVLMDVKQPLRRAVR